VAEDDVLKLLNNEKKEVRTQAARMLMVVGTKKCVPALTRASTDGRDLLASATAKSALAQVRQRLDNPKAAPPAGGATQRAGGQP
jgi:HEAT repeat protein